MLNLANALSVLRIVLAPIAVAAIFSDHWGWAIAIVAVASVTDGLDGLAARKLNQRTEMGERLDPLADKVLLVSLFLALTFAPQSKASIPLWLTVLVIARDVLILAGALIIRSAIGVTRFAPTLLGKISTTFQMLTVVAVLVDGALFSLGLILVVLFALTTGATVVSGFDYFWHGVMLWKAPPKEADR